MKGRNLKLRWLVMIAISLVVLGAEGRPQESREAFTPPAIVPRTWDDIEMASTTLPLANPHATPKHITADYYYRIPVRPIYKSYPVYALGKEPTGIHRMAQTPGTTDRLRLVPAQNPGDWIRAGEIVFDAPIFYDAVVKPAHIKDPRWYESTSVLVGKGRNTTLFPICDPRERQT